MAAKKKANNPTWYVLESYGKNPDGEYLKMSLYDLWAPKHLGGLRGDDWFAGQKFRKPIKEPVIAGIREGDEKGELVPFWGTPPIMSNEFYKALCDAGVDNLDVYDCILQSKDKRTRHKGFKAFNVLGLVRAADLKKTKFNPGSSQLIDASIDTLEIDPNKAKGILMFRLAEYVSAVIVHERVKRHIEPMKFPYVQFTEPGDFASY